MRVALLASAEAQIVVDLMRGGISQRSKFLSLRYSRSDTDFGISGKLEKS